jgi:hypothetical protein
MLASRAVAVAVLAAVCAAVTPQCGNVDGFDLTAIPASTLRHNQLFEGGTTLYEWVFSPCLARDAPPARTTSCGVPGYAQQFTIASTFTSGTCVTTWGDMVSNWRYVESTASVSAVFLIARENKYAHVSIACGGTAALQAGSFSSPFQVTRNSENDLDYVIELTSSAMCHRAHTPAPGPSTAAPRNGTSAGGDTAGGVTGGFWFILAVGLALLFYVGGTIAFYAGKQGKRGCPDLVPHREFWMDFPRRCLDGCIFTKDKIAALIGKCRGESTSSSYSKV